MTLQSVPAGETVVLDGIGRAQVINGQRGRIRVIRNGLSVAGRRRLLVIGLTRSVDPSTLVRGGVR